MFNSPMVPEPPALLSALRRKGPVVIAPQGHTVSVLRSSSVQISNPNLTTSVWMELGAECLFFVVHGHFEPFPPDLYLTSTNTPGINHMLFGNQPPRLILTFG